ncbi:GNAT family N-acetyltransferase [Acinetobacter amyesii]|uniref:GNAT family N-acetyltransferase n=1 Tax=Acinetobacter amyesii TaxID=2942470 RepID=UPI0020BF2976|nr:GNAT family N-acetyltransferase [Acinetobacter amyesii]MCL6242882.1 GNAT family N-acetyltransferase [Acinetobacter amyesii]
MDIHPLPNNLKITDDKNEMDLDTVHRFLSHTYWSKNIPKHVVKKAIENSLAVALLLDDEIIGFGRAITDYATFAYLADIYVADAHRGKDYSKLIVSTLFEKCGSADLRRMLLATADAHGLYRQFGFTDLAQPASFLEIHQANIYQR